MVTNITSKKGRPAKTYICRYCQSEVNGAKNLKKHQGSCSMRPVPRGQTQTPQEYIRTRTTITDKGCWEWNGYRNQDGYGSASYRGEAIRAHRLSYRSFSGSIAVGMNVCHRCDNPACCNPDHLFLGTQEDNIRDMHEKRRHVSLPGIKNPNAKLTDDQVKMIHAAHQAGANYEQIAAKYNVSSHLVQLICKGKSWAHLHLVPDTTVRNKGKHHHSAKLTPEKVVEIRRLHAEGSTYKQLCQQYGMGSTPIGRIVKRERWKDVA